MPDNSAKTGGNPSALGFKFYNAHKHNFLPYSSDIAAPIRSNVSVVETYRNRSCFLTGATGFVGKVILEKMIRSFRDVKKIYVLVRPRKGHTPQERLRSEVLTSPVFTRCREEIPNFDEYCETKLHAVAGELTSEMVGLSESDYQMLADNCNIIIHCAAVVDFNERIDRAIELNTLGSLRMLELGKKCADLGAFVHVSTCYVNSNRENGHVEERLYPLGFDPEELIQKVSKMSTTELETVVSTGILQNWPNTYTMTKAMTEHLLFKYRGSVPLCIVRPSIVGSTYTEPMPGWVDVLSAAGAVYTAMGHGILRFMEGKPNCVGDIIPVDFVSNTILVASAVVYGQVNSPFICQSASSSENPMAWGYPLEIVPAYFKANPPPRGIATPQFQIYSPQFFQIRFFLEYSVPSAILNTLALTGNPDYKKKAALFAKLLWQTRVLTEAFRYFVENQWCFDNRNVRACNSMLTPEDLAIFDLSLAKVDWFRFSELFSYGLVKYTLKIPTLPALARDARYLSIIDSQYNPNKDSVVYRWLPDFARIRDLYQEKYLSKTAMYPAPLENAQMRQLVFNSPEVRAAIEIEAKNLATMASGKKKSTNPNDKGVPMTPLEQAESRAKHIISEMFADQDERVITGMAYFFTKLWRKLYESIKIGQENLPLVQYHASQSATKPIIYIPTHRSYVDFLLLSYVCYMVNLPLPHIVAGEDFLGIFAVRWLFRKSGAFFMKRSFSNDPLYSTILQKNVDVLLQNGQSIEFFIEGTRSRSGKMLQPKMGLLGKVISALHRGIVQDVTIVPISLNYEKTMETYMYANELHGDSKIKESLSNLVKARSIFTNNFGTTTVVFGKPFSLLEFRETFVKNVATSTIQDFYSAKNFVYQNALLYSPLLPVKVSADVSTFPAIAALSAFLQAHYDDFHQAVSTHFQARLGSGSKYPASSAPSTTSTGQWLQHVLKGNSTGDDVMASVGPASTGAAVTQFEPHRHSGHRAFLTKTLGHYLTYTINTSNEVFGTHILATLLLQYRTGITQTQLLDRLQWLINQIFARGGYVTHFEMSSLESFLANAVKKLGTDLVQTTKRGTIYEPLIHAASGRTVLPFLSGTESNPIYNYTNLLVLGQYKNKLIHFFYYESLWCVVIYALLQHGAKFSGANPAQGISVNTALTYVKFLHALLRTEFITSSVPDGPVDFVAILHTMQERNTVVLTPSTADPAALNVAIDPTHGEFPFSFFCSLLWPSIDSLYAATIMLLSLTSSHSTLASTPGIIPHTPKSQTITKDVLVLHSQWYANSLYHDNLLCFYEACSKDTLDNILTTFKELGLLSPATAAGAPIAPTAPKYFSALMSNNNSDVYVLAPHYVKNANILESMIDLLNLLRKQPQGINSLLPSTTGTSNLIGSIAAGGKALSASVGDGSQRV